MSLRPLFAVLVLGAVVVGPALARGPAHEPPAPAEAAARIGEHLELDAGTVEAITTILADAQAEGIPLRADVEAAEADLRAFREAGEPDDKRLRKLVHVVADARAEVALLQLTTTDRVAALLTPEQAEQFRFAAANRARRMHAARAADATWARGEGLLGPDGL